jgi:hypothetical protein
LADKDRYKGYPQRWAPTSEMGDLLTSAPDAVDGVFQIHGVDAAGNVTVCRQLKRRYVGVAALLMATSAAHAKKVCLGEWKPQSLMRQLVRAVLPLGRGKGTLTAVAVS